MLQDTTACNNCRYKEFIFCAAPEVVIWIKIPTSINPDTGLWLPEKLTPLKPQRGVLNATGNCPYIKTKPSFRDGWREWLGFQIFGGSFYLDKPESPKDKTS